MYLVGTRAYGQITSLPSNILDLLRKKKKVEKENSRLAAQVEELKKRLEDLEKVKVVNGAASPTREEGVDTSVDAERVSVYMLSYIIIIPTL